MYKILYGLLRNNLRNVKAYKMIYKYVLCVNVCDCVRLYVIVCDCARLSVIVCDGVCDCVRLWEVSSIRSLLSIWVPAFRPHFFLFNTSALGAFTRDRGLSSIR